MFFNRTDDLENIAKKRLDAQYGANKNVQEMKAHDTEFNKRMFGLRDKDDYRKELREANTPQAKVDNLRQKMNNANTFNKNNFGGM